MVTNTEKPNEGPLRLAIVGAGGIAQAYAQAIATTDEVELVAVVDVNLPAATAMADAAGTARGSCLSPTRSPRTPRS